MKPTDEDVEAALNEAFLYGNEDYPGMICAALEAYTPRLIERLAREAEGKCSHVDCGPCRQGDKTAKFLRSHLETPND